MVEPVQHLVRNLRVARLVGAHQAKAVAAQDRGKPIDQEKDRESNEDRCLAYGGPGG
jgi:hypothetical protein